MKRSADFANLSVYPARSIEFAKDALRKSVQFNDYSGCCARLLNSNWAKNYQSHSDEWQLGALRAESFWKLKRKENCGGNSENDHHSKGKEFVSSLRSKSSSVESRRSSQSCEDIGDTSDNAFNDEKMTAENDAEIVSTEENVVINVEDGEETTLKKTEDINTHFSSIACDLCDFVANQKLSDKEQMREIKQHAVSANHSFASRLVFSEEVTSSGEKSLKRLFVLEKSINTQPNTKNHVALTDDIVPQCSDCHELFPNIWMCSLHCEIFHQQENKFSLGKVLSRSSMTNFNTSIKCDACGAMFSKKKGLKVHFRKYKNHDPNNNDVKNQEKSFIFCLYCKKNFSNLGHLKGHMKTSPYCSKGHKEAVQVSTVLIENMCTKFTLPPFSDEVSYEDRVKQDLQVYATGLTPIYSNNLSKHQKREIKMRVKKLKASLGANNSNYDYL